MKIIHGHKLKRSLDSDSMNVFPFLLVYLIPIAVYLGFHLGGWYHFLTPLLVFVVVPVLDYLVGSDKNNPAPTDEAGLQASLVFRMITWIGTPIQVGLVFWGGYVVANYPMSIHEMAGFILSVGISSGVVGINISHELQHRVDNKFEPLLARLMLWSVFYLHWAIEHIAGHHRWVATHRDPATARLGESYYAFWPRSVFGGIKSAWEIENKRLYSNSRKGLFNLNRLVYYLLTQLLLILLFYVLFAWIGVLFLILQSIIAISLLEVVNYIEHYGLLRRQMDEQRYEAVKPHHSWNSSHRLTNYFLFNLQRHSDHHYKPSRRYPILRHFEESPQLPTGYAGMILLALVPFLWRRYMDPKVLDLRNR